MTPGSSGTYQVTMTSDELCEAFDDIYIALYDESQVDVNNLASICPGENVTFQANGIYDSILWSDGFSGNSMTVSPTTTTNYTVTTFFNSCSATQDLTVNVVQTLFVDLGQVCRFVQVTR